MVFNPNRPIANELLSDSQPLLLSNNQDLDTSFGVDHYPFSNATGNNGFHNKVTTPVFVDSPPTGLPPVTTSDPIFYAFQDTANLGVLHYSRGPSDAVPTPLTTIFSPSTPLSIGNSSSTAVFDFTGIAVSHATLRYSLKKVSGGQDFVLEFLILFTSVPQAVVSAISLGSTVIASGTFVSFSGNVLSITTSGSGACTNLYWDLKFHRIQT